MPPKQQQQQQQPSADRMRMNVQQVREQQQINRDRKAQDELEAQKQQQREARAKAQFSHVQSRVAAAAAGGASSSQNPGMTMMAQAEQQYHHSGISNAHDDVEITVFVRECEPDGGVQRMMESEILRENARQNGNAPALPSLPQHRAASMPRQQQLQPPSSSSQRRVPLQTQQDNAHKPGAPDGSKLGSVPSYIRQRKAELQAEKDAAARAIEEEKERSRHPAGHRPVEEPERLAVLEKLTARKLELERDLARLPMRFDTLAVQRRRGEIEKEMGEVEEAHRRFSVKKQLYVPM